MNKKPCKDAVMHRTLGQHILFALRGYRGWCVNKNQPSIYQANCHFIALSYKASMVQ